MSQKTIARIDQIVKRINFHPEYSIHINRKITNQLLHEAAKHSMSIELLAENGEHIDKPNQSKILENLNFAWDYLGKYGIRVSTLSGLGAIIEPSDKHSGFRKTQTMFGGFYPPAAEAVPFKVDDLVWFLNNTNTHPVLRAIEAHIKMVNIHPYIDGNGRAARLLQNFCLQQANYSPAIITSSERELYIGLLERTMKVRYDKTSTITEPALEEFLFHEFIASKVLASTEQLEEELQKRRVYELTLINVPNPGFVISLSRDIRCYAKADNRGVSVSKDQKRRCRRGNVCLEIMGDIGKEELELVLDRKTVNNTVNYRLKSVI